MKVPFSVFVLIFAVQIVLGHEHELFCESSDASPFVHHVQWLVVGLRRHHELDVDPRWCLEPQSGKKANHCSSTMKHYSLSKDGKRCGAALQLCAGPEEPSSETRHWRSECANFEPGLVICDFCGGYTQGEVADWVEELIEKCRNPHRVGGKIKLSTGGDIRVIRMPG